MSGLKDNRYNSFIGELYIKNKQRRSNKIAVLIKVCYCYNIDLQKKKSPAKPQKNACSSIDR